MMQALEVLEKKMHVLGQSNIKLVAMYSHYRIIFV